GVLGHLANQLQRHGGHRFTFVSGDKAPDLRSLCELARTSDNDAETFFKAVESTPASPNPFCEYCTGVGLDPSQPSNRATAYSLLQRIEAHLFDDSRAGVQEVQMHARYLIVG